MLNPVLPTETAPGAIGALHALTLDADAHLGSLLDEEDLLIHHNSMLVRRTISLSPHLSPHFLLSVCACRLPRRLQDGDTRPCLQCPCRPVIVPA